jgi:hypothetical protein
MFKKKALWIVGLIGCLSLQAHAWPKREGVGKASVKGVASIEAEWVKDKDDKYDVSMKIKNDSSATVLFFAGDMKCSRGSETGNVDIHQDRRTIDLRPNESRTVVMTCRLSSKNKGYFKITMKPMSNPTNDSNTPGKALAEQMTWKQGETEGKEI